MPEARVSRGWLLAAVGAAAALVLSAPFIGQLRAFVREATGTGERFAAVLLAGVGGVVIVALAAALARIRERRPLRYVSLGAALAIGVGYATLMSTGNPEVDAVERFHFVEYGILAALFYRVWRPLGDGALLVMPVLAGIVVGALEEWFQWFIPARVGEIRDVLLNSVAMTCGLLFSLGVDPPAIVTLRLTPVSREQAGRLAAVAILVCAGFVHSAHVGYEIRDQEAGVFRSRYSADELNEIGRARAVQWKAAPPITWSRLSREDQYLSEGLAHVQRRNEAWGDGEIQAARHENLILEKYYAPVIDTPSYTSPTGHRWPASQRADANSRTGPGFMIYDSDALPYPVVTWPKRLFWTVVGTLTLMVLLSTRRARARPAVAWLAVVLLGCGAAQAQTVGEPLPRWTPGTLDIHQINTGRGNAAFFMLPDGTTLLVDAGNGGNLPPRGTPPRPDASRTPGEWIARYIAAMGATAIDYGYLTHFHVDHMNALVDVAGRVPIRKMLDRAWPDYNYPAADHAEFLAPPFVEYRDFLRTGATKPERFQPGRTDQIVLTREPAKFPDFQVRNVAANGEVWTGVGTATRRHFPPLDGLDRDDWPTENMCSQAIRISYGRFDYYTGGDMPGRPRPGYPAWHDVETPVARAVGPVDVAVLNHHGNRDSTNAFLVSTLRPRMWVIPVWSSDHPGHDVLDRMYSTRLYPGPRDVVATNMIEANKIVIGPLLDRLASSQGHIVIRVAPGGASYQVIVLDDSAETYRVTKVLGPFLSE
jgi:beta-lactamase superfamily II metal-dependent hydrolase